MPILSDDVCEQIRVHIISKPSGRFENNLELHANNR
jgi:hypothetical protein